MHFVTFRILNQQIAPITTQRNALHIRCQKI